MMYENYGRKLDKSSPIPLYFQLESWLKEEIKKGRYPVGESIPTEVQLTEMFGVSRTTVRQAVNDLIQEGWLVRNGTRGTAVAVPGHKSVSVRSMVPFSRQMTWSGQKLRTEVLETRIVEAGEELAGYFGIHGSDRLISIFRRRFADEVAVMTIRNYVVYERNSFMLNHDFGVESWYEVMSSREETRSCQASQEVEAQMADSEDMKLFCLEELKPILSLRCWDRNSAGEVVNYSLIRYRGDLVKFKVDVKEDTAENRLCPQKS